MRPVQPGVLILAAVVALASLSTAPASPSDTVRRCTSSLSDDSDALEVLEWRQEGLVAARERVFDAESSLKRQAALWDLVNLLSSTPCLADEIVPTLEEMRWERDVDIAVVAETALARHEGREPDLGLLAGLGYTPPPPTPAPIERERLDMLAHPDAGVRLSGIEWVMELAVTHDLWVKKGVALALEQLLDDPDPRVAHRAEFALRALAGDPHALEMVYVAGQSVDLPLPRRRR